MIYIISILVIYFGVSMISGKEQTDNVVIVTAELDTSKKLNEQLQSFGTMSITRSEAVRMRDSVVSDLDDLNEMYLISSLPLGSPVPRSLLSEGDIQNDFVGVVRIHATHFRVYGGALQLPKGAGVGDMVNIGLIYEETRINKEISPILHEIKIARIEEENLYVEVSLEESFLLTLASEIGKIVIQLPGQRDVPFCSELTLDERDSTDCYSENEKPKRVTEQDIRRIMYGQDFYFNEKRLNELYEEELKNEEFERNGYYEDDVNLSEEEKSALREMEQLKREKEEREAREREERDENHSEVISGQ
jgi:hypothetical protein